MGGAYGFGEQEFEQLRRAREELRRLLGSLEGETPESLRAAVEKAEGLLGQVISAAAPDAEAGVRWVGPGFGHEAIAEAHLAIVTALQRLDGALSAGQSEPSEQPEVDGLTGLAGRAGFERQATELSQSIGINDTCWLLVIGVDRFRDLNQQHGHPAGDLLLKQLADALADAVPAGAIVARHGGDEFAAVLQDLELSQVRPLAEAIRTTVDKLPSGLHATLTVGVAGWFPAQEHVRDALARGDRALNEGKRRGGNCVHVDGVD
jgi:diguanylate cyclase (GGDEF)-like protein